MRADLDERAHVPALHLRERPLKQDLDVGGRALHLLALHGPQDLASAKKEDDREEPDDHQQLDEAESSILSRNAQARG